MNCSPDYFHQIRVSNSSFKASNFNLQLLEFKSHNLIVQEYQYDILNHLLSLEASTVPNLSLIQQQPEINLKMRPLLLDFLMDVINKLNLSKSTFPSTVNLIDRYCSTRIVKKQHYQLLGLTCLWISCKNLDSKSKIPNLNDLSKMCCNCYDKKLFLEMENHLLKLLNWMITIPTFDSFIDLYLNLFANFQLANCNNMLLNDLKILSIYICELIQFYPNIYFNYNTSLISLTSFLIATKVLNLNVNVNEFLFNLNEIIDLSDNEGSSEVETSKGKHSDKDFFTFSKFSNLSKLLMKILKCPPPSLKAKYFNESSKFIKLMEKLINFTNFNLEPLTPRAKLPPTPSSNNISPTSITQKRQLDHPVNPDHHQFQYQHGTNKINFLPSPNSPQFNIHPPLIIPHNRKRSHDNNDKVDLKRSKSVPIIFSDS